MISPIPKAKPHSRFPTLSSVVGQSLRLLRGGFFESFGRLDHRVELPRDLSGRDRMDHGWWYYSGHLECPGKTFGFHLVFFRRRALVMLGGGAHQSFKYYAHFSLTDVETHEFRYAHRRSSYGNAGALIDRYHVWLDDWSVGESNGRHVLRAKMNAVEFELSLAPVKAPVMHGHHGLVHKSDNQQACHFSFPRLEGAGTLNLHGTRYHVQGTAWMDREFGNWVLTDQIQGWDWFAVQLQDGRELMLYLLRNRQGQLTPYSALTLIEADGRLRHFDPREFSLSSETTWTSPTTGTAYPRGWNLSVPALEAQLSIEPVMGCQELDTRGSTMVVYWEGAATAQGRIAGHPVAGRAYVELVGYDQTHQTLTLLDFLKGELQLRKFGRGRTVLDLPQAVC